MKSRPDRYGSVAVTIHWLSALAILVLLGSGFSAALTMDPVLKITLLRLHVPLAIAVLALTLARIFWWALADRKPAPMAAARAVHGLLYFALFVMLGSGIGLIVTSGAGVVLFGGAGTLPDFTLFPPRIAHGLGALLLAALLAAHIGAALYHHLVRRDAIFERMWYRR